MDGLGLAAVQSMPRLLRRSEVGSNGETTNVLEEEPEEEEEGGIHGLALRRCLRQLACVHRSVPGYAGVWEELDCLARQHGDLGFSDAWSEDEEGAEGGPDSPARGGHGVQWGSDRSETDKESVYDEEDDSSSSGSDRFENGRQKALDLHSHTPINTKQRQQEDGNTLLKVAFPARAFLDNIGGVSLGTQVTKQRQQALKQLNQQRLQQESSPEEQAQQSSPTSPNSVQLTNLTALENSLRTVDAGRESINVANLLGQGLVSIETKIASAITRIIRQVKEEHMGRWGELSTDQTKVLQVKVRAGLSLVRDPEAVVPKLTQYITSMGSDWDDLIMDLSLTKATMHLWADQELIKASAIETNPVAPMVGSPMSRPRPGNNPSKTSPPMSTHLEGSPHAGARPSPPHSPEEKPSREGPPSPLGGSQQGANALMEHVRRHSTEGIVEREFAATNKPEHHIRRNSTESPSTTFGGIQKMGVDTAVHELLATRQSSEQQLLNVSNRLKEFEILGEVQRQKLVKRLRMSRAIKDAFRTGKLKQLMREHIDSGSACVKKDNFSSSFFAKKSFSATSGSLRLGQKAFIGPGGNRLRSESSFVLRSKAALRGPHTSSMSSLRRGGVSASLSEEESVGL